MLWIVHTNDNRILVFNADSTNELDASLDKARSDGIDVDSDCDMKASMSGYGLIDNNFNIMVD